MSDANKILTSSPPSAVTKSLRDHWRLFLAEGIILIFLGSAAVIVPVIASLAITVFLGWLFIIGGGAGLAITIAGRHAPGFCWSLISALVTIVAGAFMLGWPIGGTISLTLVLTVYLIADGVVTILLGLAHRREKSQRWVGLEINGVLDLILAGIIIWALPQAAVWALGLIVGIDLVFGGFSLVTMAFAARDLKPN